MWIGKSELVNTCGFEGARRGDYFKGEPVNMSEMEGIKKGTEGREEVVHKVLKGRKVWGTMAKLWKGNMISREVKREL